MEERDEQINETILRTQFRSTLMQQLKLSTKLNRITERAKQNSEAVFDNLAHLITKEHLERSFYDLKRSSSAGVDGVSYQGYEKSVKENISDLYNRLRQNKYRAQPLKRVYIPKEDGKKRPLSIPSLEDKIVQRTVVRILNCIYEQDFLPCSYGYRPKRNAHQAIKAVRNKISTDNVSYVLDADIQDFFGAIDRKLLMSIVEKRVKDKTILRLIGKWLKTGHLEEGALKTSSSGTPQGSVISPLLANIYLHEVLDLWVYKTVKKHTTGLVELYRFADDFIMCFQSWDDAKKVYEALPKRFSKFGLTLHPKKTKLMRFGRFAQATILKKKQGKKPPTFNFLGFTFKILSEVTGIPETHLSQIENDKIDLGVKRAEVLSAALGVRPQDILFPDGIWKEDKRYIEIAKKAERYLKKVG